MVRMETAFAIPHRNDPYFLNAVVKSLYANDSNLLVLDLSDMALTDANMLRLADAISCNSKLKELNLSTNQLTYLSMEDFSNSLVNNSSITSLNLSENAIGSEGATKLSPAFCGQQRLVVRIILHFLDVTVSFVRRICRLLSLDISCNVLSDEGAAAVLAPPGSSASLVALADLNISENGLSGGCAEALCSFLQRTRCSCPPPNKQRNEASRSETLAGAIRPARPAYPAAHCGAPEASHAPQRADAAGPLAQPPWAGPPHLRARPRRLPPPRRAQPFARPHG